MNFVSATVRFNNLSQIPFYDRVDRPLGLFTAFYIPSLSIYHPLEISDYYCVWCIMSKQCIFILFYSFMMLFKLRPIVSYNDLYDKIGFNVFRFSNVKWLELEFSGFCRIFSWTCYGLKSTKNMFYVTNTHPGEVDCTGFAISTF